jgi:hypothetical protein
LVYDGSDVDSDGIANESEFIAGTDPFNETDFPSLTNGTYETTNLCFRFACATTTARTYRLQHRTNLATGAWADCTAPVSGTGTSLTFRITNTVDSTRYYRLQICTE